MKRKITLLLALIMAFGAAFLVYKYLEKIEAEYQASQDLAQVVVAREQIPPQTKINMAMISVKKIPRNLIHPQAASSPDDLVNKISNTVLYPGEQVLLPKLVAPGDFSHGIAYNLEPGKRALAVAVDQVVGVGGFLSPGNRVDVAVLLENVSGDQVAFLAAQNLRVLSVGPMLHRPNSQEPAKDFHNVTLEVTPEEALKMLMAVEKGRIRLLLRPAVKETLPNPPQLRYSAFSS
ncbi:MAG: Flp pilus assembly protein CpaB [Syntrophomonadaceae bacterium]|nr:Flp pilus assembly protein CpaB [Syntrophomonadaceae bacterium]